MKKTFLILIVFPLLFSCKDNDAPDVSNININLKVERFEQDFFKMDTTNLANALQQLGNKYPAFLGDYLGNIMGLPPFSDSSTQVLTAIKKFLSDYKPVKDSADKVFSNTNKIEEDVKKSLQYVKHYFPAYHAPNKLITFIGPMDAFFEASIGSYGDVITRDGLAVGLQLHLGSNFSLYKSEMGQALYPTYVSRRFAPEYIPVNCIKNVIDDLFPDKSIGKSLLEQMVEKGKRLYVLDKLMPFTGDTLKIGYTQQQLKGCIVNEGLIWNFFVTNNLLYNSEPGLIKNYIGEGPNTPEFGEGAPGYIGLFTGWQIVKKYMEKNDAVKLEELMGTDAKKIYEISKYRPK